MGINLEATFDVLVLIVQREFIFTFMNQANYVTEFYFHSRGSIARWYRANIEEADIKKLV